MDGETLQFGRLLIDSLGIVLPKLPSAPNQSRKRRVTMQPRATIVGGATATTGRRQKIGEDKKTPTSSKYIYIYYLSPMKLIFYVF